VLGLFSGGLGSTLQAARIVQSVIKKTLGAKVRVNDVGMTITYNR